MFTRIFSRAKMTLPEAVIALNGAVRGSDTERIKKLVADYPELLCTSDDKGAYPLHWAAEAQSLASVACLVDLGANIQQKDRLGYTAEQVAYWYGEFRMGAYTDASLKIVERLKNGPITKNA